jgi:uncharacterized protein
MQTFAPPEEPQMREEQLALASDEDLEIFASLDVPQRPRGVVILVHGFKGFKEWGFFPWVAERFRERHLAVFRFNMSRSGVSGHGDEFNRLDLFEGDTYGRQIADLARVAEHVACIREFRSLPIFLFGHSRGGAVSILGAHRVPRLRGIVTWSAISRTDRWDDETKRRWRSEGFLEAPNARTGQMMRMGSPFLDDLEQNREAYDVLGATSRLSVPLLVVHGESDETVGVEEAREICSHATSPALMTIASATHTFCAIHPLIHVPYQLRIATEVSARFIVSYC